MNETDTGGAADLQEQRRFLLASLRDLEREREAGDIDEADYLVLRDDYTARAAAVLREIEREEMEPATGDHGGSGRVRGARSGTRRRHAPTSPRARAPSRKRGGVAPGVYVVAVIAAVIVGAGIGVVAFSADEPADERAGGTSVPASPLERRLDDALQLERDDKAVEALQAYDAVLGEDPDNVRALTYRGWLLARANLVDRAMESLDRAVAVDPRYPDAHFLRGMVLFRYKQDPQAAIPEFEAFLATKPPPEFATGAQRMLDEARQAVAAGPGTGG